MKAISILGTSSNAGKSWVATALCAWLRRQGIAVAPFKAQNMANNAYATLEGGEIGVAQAVQAEACGLRPTVEMNPILLKPNGPDGSQIVRLGKAGETLSARNYYGSIDRSWAIVKETLDGWKQRCDVLVLEGAGSPVELNLMDRDIVNLRPVEYLDGKWLLTSNIEYGGVFAQVIGSWGLLPEEMKARGLGFLVNRFRGDISLFDAARREFEARLTLPYLGVLPFESSLKIDDEDSLNTHGDENIGDGEEIAWIRFPRVSNSQDQLPWRTDTGVRSVWTESPEVVSRATAIVLPGSKNTIADLRWLKARGLAELIKARAAKGIAVAGICGGYQMLGEELSETATGDRERGLGLLPLRTRFESEKTVTRRMSRFFEDEWETFEIHTGVSEVTKSDGVRALLETGAVGSDVFSQEGMVNGKVWGSYQHGLFESPQLRRRFLDAAGIRGADICQRPWHEARRVIYDRMADLMEARLDLNLIKRYLGI